MSALEYSLAGLFALAGVRSFVIWIRRGFEAADTLDHVLYALHLMARVGLWFAFAGFFAIYGSLAGSGRPLADELAAVGHEHLNHRRHVHRAVEWWDGVHRHGGGTYERHDLLGARPRHRPRNEYRYLGTFDDEWADHG